MADERRRQIDEVRETGYSVVRGFLPADRLRRLDRVARELLAAREPPVEFEADLRYPGAPTSRGAAGGDTVRRLLDAYRRHPELAASATTPRLREWMEAYFGEEALMSRAHHNCVMTKHPLYGSLTGWHRDIRYWAFEREDLVSVWMALGEETDHNGALWLVPGSHRETYATDRFDELKFFRGDRPDNAGVIATAVSPKLMAGDAIFFHCNTLHSAGQNRSDAVKYSLVYTYHARSNRARPHTRSASTPEVALTR